MDGLGAILWLSIALRATPYPGTKLWFDTGFEPPDWVVAPIGLGAAYVGCMYLRRMFGRLRPAG